MAISYNIKTQPITHTEDKFTQVIFVIYKN